MTNKTLTGSTAKLVLDIINAITFALTAFTGLLIQIHYHQGRIGDYDTVWGLQRSEWHDLHIIISFLALAGLIYHFILNWKPVKLIFFPKDKKLSSKYRMSRRLTWLFAALSITGLVSYSLYISGLYEIRHGMMEIHDKIGVIITIIFAIHFIQHFSQLYKPINKRLFPASDKSTGKKSGLSLPGRHKQITDFIWLNDKKCEACWQCIESCKRNVFKKIDLPFHKHAMIGKPGMCTGCGQCIKACQFNAILAVAR